VHHLSDTVNMEARRRLVLERYCDGATMRQISREFDVSVATIHSDVRFCRDQWREDMNHCLESWKDHELDRIDKLELMAMEGWERSLRDHAKSSTEETRNSDDTTKKAKLEKQNRDGDPRFLKVLAECISERCKILGLYAPKKTDLTSGGSPIKFIGGVDAELV
jgi:hypothetical protein